jgi:ketosteroid isomerase-like protein
MPTSTSPIGEEQIRTRLESLVQALRAKDIGALMAHYAPDNVTFDLRPPLQVLGADAYKKNFEAWFASVQGPIGFAIHDLRITATEEVAFCHYLGHVESTRTTGDKADYWVRVTAGLRKMNGRWMISHEHISMPFYMDTMQAALDLQP